MPSTHVFAWDPGDQNIGFCYFRYESESKVADLKIKKIMTPSEVHNILRVVWGLAEPSENKCYFVVENFRVDTKVRGAKFQWNEMKTARMIGKIELIAEWTGSKLILQEPGILSTGRKYCDFHVPKGHIPDDVSAYIHGVHFMVNAQMIQTTDQITRFGQAKVTQ